MMPNPPSASSSIPPSPGHLCCNSAVELERIILEKTRYVNAFHELQATFQAQQLRLQRVEKQVSETANLNDSLQKKLVIVMDREAQFSSR